MSKDSNLRITALILWLYSGLLLPHSSVYGFDEIIREASKRVAKNNKPLILI